MCNLQSNLKLNKRERKKERNADEGRNAAHKRMHGESPQHLYSWNPSRISPRSLLALSAEVWGKKEIERERECGAAEEGRRDSTMRTRIARHCRPPCIPSQTPSEATEILDAPLCFWLLKRVKIPACKTLSEREGSLKMFRKRRTARIT